MTRSPRLSLRARLLAGLIAVTAVFLIIMGTVSTFVISGHLSAQFDDTLLAAVGETPAQLEASPAFALAGVGPRGTVVEYANGSPYELARLDRTSSLNLTETDLAVLVRDAAADASAPGAGVAAGPGGVPRRRPVAVTRPRAAPAHRSATVREPTQT